MYVCSYVSKVGESHLSHQLKPMLNIQTMVHEQTLTAIKEHAGTDTAMEATAHHCDHPIIYKNVRTYQAYTRAHYGQCQ